MEFLDHLVEDRIREAQRRGDLDHLPGAGRPLNLDDDSMVPPELRMAYRILKNAGFAPPEVAGLQELRQLLAGLSDSPEPSDEQKRGRQRLSLLLHRLESAGLGRTSRAILAEYESRLLEKLSQDV